MKSTPTTPSSRRLMTSKLRLLGNGIGTVYLNSYLSLLRPPAFALLGPLIPLPATQD